MEPLLVIIIFDPLICCFPLTLHKRENITSKNYKSSAIYDEDTVNILEPSYDVSMLMDGSLILINEKIAGK